MEDHLINLRDHCLKNTYFTYNRSINKQKERQWDHRYHLANIFMEGFENSALDTAKFKQKLWPRYVDDTFIIWTHGEDKLQEFLSPLSSIHPKIKFTTVHL
ncbi:hypothetical protein Trydic_g6417 [Trypoxylus dichotomus]